jgi:hypothetical protein
MRVRRPKSRFTTCRDGVGYTFNLRERELETLLEARTANTATEVLRGDWAAG